MYMYILCTLHLYNWRPLHVHVFVFYIVHKSAAINVEIYASQLLQIGFVHVPVLLSVTGYPNAYSLTGHAYFSMCPMGGVRASNWPIAHVTCT